MQDEAATTATAAPAVTLRPVSLTRELAWWVGVAACASAVAAFVVARLTAWPPHEDEVLALFTGRESMHDAIRTVLNERGGAPLHYLFAWLIAHTGGGLIELRLVSALFAVASVPLIALLVARISDRMTALVATAIVSPSWMLLFHGVYGRMYSLFLFTSLVSYLALLNALERRGRTAWTLWVLATLACIATHPYGALLLASQGLYVVLLRRARIALPAFAVVSLLAIPFWRTDFVLAGRFDVGVGGGGARLGGPTAVGRYLARVAGDFTGGWTIARVLVLTLALVGLVLLARERRSSALLFLCNAVAPATVFMLMRVGSGMASPEGRHLIFVLPFFATLLALPLVRLARSSLPEGLVLAAVAVISLGALEIGWGMHNTPRLYKGEPRVRTEAREAASAWLAATSRPDDVLFGYDPLFLGAWERNVHFSETVVPRADTKLALHVLYRARKPLGRGVWVLDASDTNNFTPKLTIPLRYPAPSSRFEVRVFGPFLVARSRKPTRTIREFLLETQAVQFVGEDLYIGDSDINLLTVERALGMRGLGALGRR